MKSSSILFCASIAGGLGAVFPALWFLAPISLAVFLYRVWFNTSNTRSALLSGFVFGFALGGAGVWWMWDMVPLPLPSDVPLIAHYILSALVWSVTAILSGVSVALATWGIYLLKNNAFVGIAVAFLWIAQEELRMWFFALYSWSPESLFGPHFSQTALGYALTESSLFLHFSQFGGIVGLSFALALTASVLALGFRFLITHDTRLQTVITLAVFCIFLGASLFFFFKNDTTLPEPIHVAVAGMDTDWQRVMSDIAKREAVDLIVFPESDRITVPDKTLKTMFEDREVLLLSSSHVHTQKGLQAELAYQSSTRGTVGTYQKIFLMPQGEYFPTVADPLYSLLHNTSVSASAPNTGNRLTRGNDLTAVPFKGTFVGGLICSDIISPHLYPTLAEKFGARVLVNVANPDWFHGSHTFHNKMLQIAKAHAVHTRSFFILSSLGTPSFVLSPGGRIIAESAWGSPQVLYTILR